MYYGAPLHCCCIRSVRCCLIFKLKEVHAFCGVHAFMIQKELDKEKPLVWFLMLVQETQKIQHDFDGQSFITAWFGSSTTQDRMKWRRVVEVILSIM